MEHTSRFGIYLNANDRKVVRINSPYWFPQEPDWVYLTAEVNATLLQIRQVARQKRLLEDVDSLTWGALPVED